MKIAICEDNILDTELLKKLVTNYCSENKIELEPVDIFTNSEFFLKNFRPNFYDIIFFDIFYDNEDITGIEIAKKIREMDEKCLFIFTTISLNHAVDAFDLYAMHYLIKPLNQEKISEALHRCIVNINKKANFVSLKSGKTIKNVYLNEVIYVDVLDNICTVHMKSGNFNIRLTLNEIEKLIKQSSVNHTFSRCHRCYLVNMEYIKEVTANTFILDDGTEIMIKHYKKNDVIKEYENFLFSQCRNEG